MYKTFCGWLVNTTWKYFFWEYLNAFFYTLPPILIENVENVYRKIPLYIFFLPLWFEITGKKKNCFLGYFIILYTLFFYLEFWMIKIITYLLVKVSNFIIFPAGLQFSLKICLLRIKFFDLIYLREVFVFENWSQF